MKTMQKGFTLIELMIVVAIIGILAAVAIPSYQDYIARAQVTEGVGLLDGFKTSFAEYYSDKGHWPTALGATGTTASINGTISGKYVNTVAITAGAGQTTPLVLTATFKPATQGVNGKIAGKVVEMTSADGATWTCRGDTLATGGTGVATNYLPGGCK